jgi:hypothetical protein
MIYFTVLIDGQILISLIIIKDYFIAIIIHDFTTIISFIKLKITIKTTNTII